MNLSPAQLPKRVEELAQEQSPRWYEARQILRALGGTCRGKVVIPGGALRYLYGPCRNLVETEDGPVCAIHDIKPQMCSGYPFYDYPQEGVDNPGYIKGCGYNRDAREGYTVAQIRAMALPLEEHER